MSFGNDPLMRIPGDFRAGRSVEVYPLASWSLEMIKFPNIAAVHNYGAGVNIAVLDTGYYNHPDLPTPLDVSVFGFGDTIDKNGHGTHVFGICASIAKNSTYFISKVLGADGLGLYSFIAKSIRYQVDKGADIIQISIGGDRYEKELHDACKYAYSKGVLIVCAAGNSGKDQLIYPAAFDECIAVGSVDINKQLSSFSTMGKQLDVVAPGEKIISTWINNGKMESSGTSMAAPVVSGICALIIDHFVTDHGHKPTIEQIRNTLYSNAIDLGLIGWDVEHGHGLAQIDFHVKEKPLKVDPPLWLNLIMKVLVLVLKLYLKTKAK